MPQLITFKNEMIRIDAGKNKIDYSTNSGRSWLQRHTFTSSHGAVIDLLPFGSEILACTSKGIFYSSNSGRSWLLRYRFTDFAFTSLQENANELLGLSTKGLYYSTNSGRSWLKRR